ncbi:MAG: DNA mismatch repair protein MutS, partial [Bacillota bacterium]|nr:DNA mismatch repair protein MutS [Bacillota bacterium]
LGMDKGMIERAHRITYKEDKVYEVPVFKREEQNELVDGAMKEEHEQKLQNIKELKKVEAVAEKQKKKPSFNIGDCVYISTMGRTGIVCETENSRGEVTVMVMKKKFKVNHKRLSLYVEGKELYPEDYDFDIVFESKENRKKDKTMNKRHVEGMTIEE